VAEADFQVEDQVDPGKQIEQAVAEAEKNTSGEIVPAILNASDTYDSYRWAFATALALLTALAGYFFQHDIDPFFLLLAQIPALVFWYMLATLCQPILRMFLPAKIREAAVRSRAINTFYANKLSQTRDRTGILIFISLLERRVEVLADVGISSKIPQATWDELVAKLLTDIKKGQQTEGVCAAIHTCGKILSEHFPRKDDDTNELPNQPVTN
jgi:putative membrane protein